MLACQQMRYLAKELFPSHCQIGKTCHEHTTGSIPGQFSCCSFHFSSCYLFKKFLKKEDEYIRNMSKNNISLKSVALFSHENNMAIHLEKTKLHNISLKKSMNKTSFITINFHPYLFLQLQQLHRVIVDFTQRIYQK